MINSLLIHQVGVLPGNVVFERLVGVVFGWLVGVGSSVVVCGLIGGVVTDDLINNLVK